MSTLGKLIVNKTTSATFKQGPSYFDMSLNPRGRCLIFNNINYECLENRNGSEEDASRFEHIFKEFGFSVSVEEDKKGNDMKIKLRDVASNNHHGDAFVIIFLAHGDDTGVLGIDSKVLSYQDMIELVNNEKAPSLQNKPKVFFVQACRGKKKDCGVLVDDGNSQKEFIDTNIENKRIPTASQIFFSFAAQHGYKTCRHSISGGLYAKCLAEVLAEYAHSHDLESLLKVVETKVSSERVALKDGVRVLSTCYEAIGWSRQLYFNPGFFVAQNITLQGEIVTETLDFVTSNFFTEDSKAENTLSPILELELYRHYAVLQAPDDLESAKIALQQAIQFDKLAFAVQCSKVLENALSPENCIDYYHFSIQFSQKVLLFQKARSFILYNFSQISKDKDFPSLTFYELEGFLASEDLFVEEQGILLEAIQLWLAKNPQCESGTEYSLLKYVNIQRCSNKCLTNAGIERRMIDSLAEENQSAQTSLRASNKTARLFVIGGLHSDLVQDCSQIEMRTLPPTQINYWVKQCQLDALDNNKSVAVTFLNRQLVLVTEKKTLIWDPDMQNWKEGRTMEHPRDKFSFAVLDGKIYVLGGEQLHVNGKVNLVNTCNFYDPSDNTWHTISSMTYTRRNASATVARGKIYCAGGISKKGKFLDSIEEYDPSSESKVWTDFKKLQYPRSEFALVGSTEALWVIGGHSGRNNTKIKDVSRLYLGSPTENWITVTNLDCPRSGIAAVLQNGMIFIIGGQTADGQASGIINVYCINSGKWLEDEALRCELNFPRYGHAATVLPGLESSAEVASTSHQMIPIEVPMDFD